MFGGLEEWYVCLYFMKLFVGFVILWYLFLFRMVVCLKVKDYSLGIVKVL